MLSQLYSACGSVVDTVTNNERFTDSKRRNAGVVFLILLLALVVLFALLFLVKFLWNKVGCKYITVLKPVPSVLELLGVLVLLHMVLPSCNCNTN
jgi:hypothetical protein